MPALCLYMAGIGTYRHIALLPRSCSQNHYTIYRHYYVIVSTTGSMHCNIQGILLSQLASAFNCFEVSAFDVKLKNPLILNCSFRASFSFLRIAASI